MIDRASSALGSRYNNNNNNISYYIGIAIPESQMPLELFGSLNGAISHSNCSHIHYIHTYIRLHNQDHRYYMSESLWRSTSTGGWRCWTRRWRQRHLAPCTCTDRSRYRARSGWGRSASARTVRRRRRSDVRRAEGTSWIDRWSRCSISSKWFDRFADHRCDSVHSSVARRWRAPVNNNK